MPGWLALMFRSLMCIYIAMVLMMSLHNKHIFIHIKLLIEIPSLKQNFAVHLKQN